MVIFTNLDILNDKFESPAHIITFRDKLDTFSLTKPFIYFNFKNKLHILLGLLPQNVSKLPHFAIVCIQL